MELDSSKALTSSVIDNLKKDQTGYYDIQIFISKDNDDTRYPIIGYKHQDKMNFHGLKIDRRNYEEKIINHSSLLVVVIVFVGVFFYIIERC